MNTEPSHLSTYLLKRKKEKGYICIPYIILGYPNWNESYQIACHLLNNGADTLELGIPFTDPTADGLIIQSAFQSVLEKDFSMEKVFQFIENLKKKFPHIPFSVMGYSNIFYHQGNYLIILSRLKDMGIFDYIIPDVPYEEQKNIFQKENGIYFVNFITLNTTTERIKAIAKVSNSFIYAVSVRGITGARKNLDIDFYKKNIALIKKYTQSPILIGFGISSREQTQQTIAYADGFIVGSYLIQAIQDGCNPSEIGNKLKKILP